MRGRIKQIEKWLTEQEVTKRDKRIIGMVLVLAIVFGGILIVLDHRPIGNIIYRSDYGEGDTHTAYEVKIGDKKETLDIVVGERKYTKEQTDEAFRTVVDKLDTLVVGKNEGLDKVEYPLFFPDKVEPYPFRITWQWSPYNALSREGEIQEEYIDEEGVTVELRAKIAYGEEEMEYIRDAMVYKGKGKEQLEPVEILRGMVEEADSEGAETDALQLPEELSGETLTWYRTSNQRGIYIIGLGGIGAFLLLYKKKKERQKEWERREKNLLDDYPEIVNTFVLYMGAGMSVKNAWVKIVGEYANGKGDRDAYDELRATVVEMKNGYSEMEAYERFATRCSLKPYQRFVSILKQSVKVGAKGLARLLEDEAREAFEERKNRARKQGEQAGTKMLMPMFLMLIVVLVVLVVPAFLSIQV